jgi:hypothetical protein
VFWFWNANVARLGPRSIVCFGFGMQVLQGWVSFPMCVMVLERKYFKVGSQV